MALIYFLRKLLIHSILLEPRGIFLPMHAMRWCPVIIATGLTGGVRSDEVLYSKM
jgi:hypothetical protein